MKLQSELEGIKTTDISASNKVMENNRWIELIGLIDGFSVQLGLAKLVLDDKLKKDLTNVQQSMTRLVQLIDDGIEATFSEEMSITYYSKEIERMQNLYPDNFQFEDEEKSLRIDMARVSSKKIQMYLNETNLSGRKSTYLINYFTVITNYLDAMSKMIMFRETLEKALKQVIGDESDLPIRNQLTLESAQMIANRVLDKAKQMKCDVVVCIANKEGNPYLIYRMEEAYVISFDLARKKAFTSAALKMPTHELAKLTADDAPLNGLEQMLDEEIVTLGGGYPIRSNNRIIGSIGVSGSTVENDIELARYGSIQVV